MMKITTIKKTISRIQNIAVISGSIAVIIFYSEVYPERLRDFENDFGETHNHGEFKSSLSGRLWMLFLLPYYVSYYDLNHYGFAPYPYYKKQRKNRIMSYVYGRGSREIVFKTKFSGNIISKEVFGYSINFKTRSYHRLGWDFEFTQYREDFDSKEYKLNLLSGHINANYIQSRRFLLEFGIGGKGLFGEKNRGGADVGLSADFFPLNPFHIEADANFSLINSQLLTDLQAGIGLVYKFLEIEFGIRSLMSPGRDLTGPKFSAVFWF